MQHVPSTLPLTGLLGGNLPHPIFSSEAYLSNRVFGERSFYSIYSNNDSAIKNQVFSQRSYSYLPINGGVLYGPLSGTTLTLSGALTYGGVTLTNAVTGTGKMVLDDSPTFSTGIKSGTTFTAFTEATILLTLGGTGATAVVNIPGTKSGTTSTSAAVTLNSLGVAENANIGGTLGVDGINGNYIGPVVSTARAALTLSGTHTMGSSVDAVIGLNAGTLTAHANSDDMSWFSNVGQTNLTYAKSTFTGLRSSIIRLRGAALSASGTGTIDNAMLLDFSELPTIGTNNAIFGFPTDNTDPTSGGGAATGRVPVIIAGAVKYLAYY